MGGFSSKARACFLDTPVANAVRGGQHKKVRQGEAEWGGQGQYIFTVEVPPYCRLSTNSAGCPL